MPLNDTLIDDEDDAEELVTQQSAMKRIDAPHSARLRSFELSDDAEMQLKELARSSRSFQTTPAEQPKPAKPLGLMGTIKEGAKGTLRALGATADTMQGDAQGVVEAAKEQAAAPKDADLERFYAHIDEQRKALGENPSLWEGIKAVGGAAIDNPRGFGLMIAEQLPNSGAALGAGAVGALAGSAAGPVGTVAGGLAGLLGANIGLETGHKALEAAQDGEFTPEEQGRVLEEGPIKGGVVTAIDAGTLGVTKFITNTTRRAVERATINTLKDNGVNVSSAAARRAAMETPEIAESVKAAQELAKQGAETLGKRIATTGGAIALETIGEGAGEYLGELAATGKANALDAVIEGFAGLGTSIGEIAATGALNHKGLNRLLDSQEEAEKKAETETKETGVEHEAIPHPTEPEKFVAVPKARAVAGIDLERDEEGNLKPVQPVSTQTDFNLANRPAFEHTAEDRIRAKELERQREEELAKNPIIIPGAATPKIAKGPTIAGAPASDLPNSALIYTVNRGGTRAKQIATQELERREKQGGDPVIANATEKPADTVKRIVATGAEKAQEEAKKVEAIPTPTLKIIKPAKTVKTGIAPVPETKKPAPKQPKVKASATEAVKPVKPQEFIAPPSVSPAPKTNAGAVPAQKPAGSVPPTQEAATTAPAMGKATRPLIDSLIKRRAAAKETGKERTINNAIGRAKEVMEGKRTDIALESKWFRVQAATIRKVDPATADILSRISEAIKGDKENQRKVKKQEAKIRGVPSQEDRIDDSYREPAIQAVSDYMDGKIPKEKLIKKFADLKMTDGQVSSVTDRATTKDWRMVDRWAVQRAQGKTSYDDKRGDLESKPKPAFSRSTSPKPKSPSHQRTESVVTAITAKWKNAPEIVIVDDMNDPAIPASVRAENARQLSQGATGEPEGFIAENKVYLVASQMNTPGDVIRVLLHESLGHFGLQRTFGNDLNKVLNQVAALRKRDVEAKAKQYGLNVAKEEDRLIAAEEVLAELAQSNPQNTLVQRAFAAIRKWLRDHIPGFGKLTLSDAEIIETILTPARRFVQEGRTGARTASASVAFSRSSAFTSAARDRFEKITDSLIYNFQDRFKPLKDIQKRAGPVTEDEDAALAEERYSGMVRARTDSFQEQMRDPLMKAIHDSKVAYEDVEKYLHALHAPSRNAAMREINPTEDELKTRMADLEKRRDTLSKDADVKRFLELRRELRQAEADIEDGIADESLGGMLKNDIAQIRRQKNVKDYAEALDKLKALRLVKPFRGDNTALSGMSDKEAKAILDKADKDGTRKALDKVSAIVDAITSRTRQIYVEGGLEKADAIDAWNNKYEHYVPLHRDEVSGNTMPKVGQGFNIRGKESKRATGSTKEVTNILAHVVAQHEAAIIRSEKARVDRALFRFASTHPDTSLWTLDNAPMVRTVDPVSGFVVERVDPTYKNRSEVLTLKIDGEEHTITFNEQSQEAMRLAASMKNLSSQELGEVTQMVGTFTRFLATMNTTANPVFVARNFLRDLQTAYVNLSDTAIAGKKAEVFRDIPSAIKGMWALSRGKKNSQWAKYAQEFKAAGGQTGWMEHYRDIGARADTLKKELAAMQPGKLNASRRALKSWWTIVNDANNAVENGARLAAYVNARRSGLSEGKAASLAKNLTVNFNARGAKSVELNAWYMFMNASIQGSARLIKALSNKQVRKIVAGVVLSGFLMDILARSMAGDDDEDGENDYDQLPEHTKAMNFVFMLDGQPVTIPMPYGYNFFASTGRKVSEMMFRENYSPVKSAADLAAVFLDAFSPTGQAGSALQYVAPTVADPFIQWAENKNFAGNPLRKEQNPFGVPKPEYQMGFKSTSAPAKWLAEALNETTGGNEVRAGFVNVNPAFFDFAVSSIVGGAGRTYLQSVSGPAKALGDGEIQAREIPFVNIFVGARPEYQTERKYFEAVKDVELVQSELKTYRQKGDTEMVKQIREEYGAQLRLKEAAETTRNVLARLRKRELALDKDDPPNKAQLRKELEEKKREVMSRFNKRYREAIAS